jgi:protein MpaA
LRRLIALGVLVVVTVGAYAGAVDRAGEHRGVRASSDRELGSNRAYGSSSVSVIPRVLPPHDLGRSTKGRPIKVTLFGNRRSDWKMLVVGCIHGNECAGQAIVRALTSECLAPRASVWAIPNLNPDGRALGSRLNGRGVDLNRNFSSGWRASGRPWDPEYSGPRPFSEPETRIARRLIEALRPDVTIWFHQQAAALVRAWGPSVSAARRFGRLAKLPFRRLPWLAGTAPNWQNHRFPGTSSFVVELPPGSLTGREAHRYAAAIKQLAGYFGLKQGARERPLRRRELSLALAHRPYMGVACRTPNSIECDRVGLAVYLPKRRPAEHLAASINGQALKMSVPAGVATHGIYFEGFLHPAGLKSGRLKVTAGQPVFAKVRITAYYRDRPARSTTRHLALAPGWG